MYVAWEKSQLAKALDLAALLTAFKKYKNNIKIKIITFQNNRTDTFLCLVKLALKYKADKDKKNWFGN